MRTCRRTWLGVILLWDGVIRRTYPGVADLNGWLRDPIAPISPGLKGERAWLLQTSSILSDFAPYPSSAFVNPQISSHSHVDSRVLRGACHRRRSGRVPLCGGAGARGRRRRGARARPFPSISCGRVDVGIDPPFPALRRPGEYVWRARV